MSKMKRMISTVLCTAFLMVQVLAISSFAFSPSESTKVNIFCGFESGDTLPMIMDPHGNPQINNPGGFKLELNSSEKYSGSKSVKASTATSEASGDPRCTFEWFPVFEGKNIHEQADLEEYYDAGNGYSFKGAEYLQLWVKNTSKSPLSLIWLTLYGKDKYQLKPTGLLKAPILKCRREK